MSYHKGNAYLANVVAANLRTPWTDFVPAAVDPYATYLPEAGNHNKFFNTRHFAVLSLNVRLTFDATTPDFHGETGIQLPPSLRVKPDTLFSEQCTVERYTGTNERKFAAGYLVADGTERGGADGLVYTAIDRIKVQSFGEFVSGQSYVVRGQLVLQPAV